MKDEPVAVVEIEADVEWQPAETYTYRFTSTLDRLCAIARATGCEYPRHLVTQRKERLLTTILIEGTVPL